MKPRIRVRQYGNGWIATITDLDYWYYSSQLIIAAQRAYCWYEFNKKNCK